MTNPLLVVLHAADTSPEQMKALVGPVPGFDIVYPRAAKNLRWDHLGNADAPALRELAGDFIAGYSSGGFMALRMVCERRYRGAMVVAAGLVKYWIPSATPMMIVHGTEDARVPYSGSYNVLGALETAVTMRKALGITASPTHTTIPNRNKADLCTAYVDDWAGRVKLFTVLNGGHTWPGATWRDPLNRIGRTCMDFSATTEMAAFFGGIA